MKQRLRPPRWLGSLLAPAEDPRRGVVDPSPVPLPEDLVAELRRSRSELAELRQHIDDRTPGTRLAQELADEERELLEAEHALLLSVDERRARAALLQARYRAAEADLRSDL